MSSRDKLKSFKFQLHSAYSHQTWQGAEILLVASTFKVKSTFDYLTVVRSRDKNYNEKVTSPRSQDIWLPKLAGYRLQRGGLECKCLSRHHFFFLFPFRHCFWNDCQTFFGWFLSVSVPSFQCLAYINHFNINYGFLTKIKAFFNCIWKWGMEYAKLFWFSLMFQSCHSIVKSINIIYAPERAIGLIKKWLEQSCNECESEVELFDYSDSYFSNNNDTRTAPTELLDNSASSEHLHVDFDTGKESFTRSLQKKWENYNIVWRIYTTSVKDT